jgi:uncharacterized protein (DUF302 family)
MTYYFAKTLDADFESAVARTREALQKQGFGVITEIDVTKTLKSKIGADFRPYLILGACNPHMAHEALQIEDKVGTMLPCNVVVQQTAPGKVEIAAIDPTESMRAIDNPRLLQTARQVGQMLQEVVSSI